MTPANPALRLWGTPELAGEPPQHFAAERRFQLLVVLALAGGAWVERDRIAALLWPDADMADARRNLRKVLFKAQAVPGVQGLEATPQALRWPVATDLAAFEATRRADPEAALAWRRGPPLQGLDDARNSGWSAWLASERARLDEAWLAVARARLGAGERPEQRADAARRLLAVDALDESAVAALMQAAIAAGRPGDAAAEYRRYAVALAQELGTEPSRALRELMQAAQGAGPGEAAAAAREPVDPFIGRRLELSTLEALLDDPGCRLLTVLGPGGIGKSSLARQALPRLAGRFPAGSAWVPLHDAQSAAELTPLAAQALGQSLGDGPDPLADLLRGWLTPGRGLLVLDNAEHLPDLPPRLQALLAALPALVLVVTSRSRLALAEERVLPLAGLAVPDDDSRDLEAAASFDAVRLFKQRAGAARRGFALAAHLPAVLAICDTLGGMPLALELAASWVRLLPPETIAEDLQREATSSLDLLERDPAAPGAPARAEHASLRAVLQGSWRLLVAREQQALAALAVFEGGFTRAAAQAVAGCPLPLLSALVDASLLAADAETGRFSMHPVVQRFARERLAEDPPRRADGAGRHAAHFAELLGTWAPLVRSDPQQLARQFAAEEANARVAWHHALDAAQTVRLRQMLPAWRALYEINGRFDEGIATLRELLQLPETDLDATRLLTHARQVLCALLYQRGHAAEALRFAEAGIESALRCGERRSLVGCRNTAALSLYLLGRAEEALPHARRMLADVEADGDRYGMVVALSTAAIALSKLGRFEDALADLNRALPIALELGHGAQIGHLYNIIGNHHRALAQWPEARANLENGLRVSEQHGMTAGVLFCSVNLALAEIELGELDTAGRRLAALMERLEQTPQQQVSFDAEVGLARIDIRRGRRHEVRERARRIEAMAVAASQPPRRLQAVQLWGEALLHEGRHAEAGALLHWLAESPTLDRGEQGAIRRQLDAARLGPPTPWPHDLETTVALMRADRP